MGRPQLEKAIAALGTGDVLVLPEWDRATRSMLDGIQIIQRVAARGALVKVLDRPYVLIQHQQAEGRRRLENGESARSIARDFNCHHAIVRSEERRVGKG